MLYSLICNSKVAALRSVTFGSFARISCDLPYKSDSVRIPRKTNCIAR